MAIKTIAIVHHVHTDFGYTDHPCRTKREHVKYINRAVDYVLKSSDYPEGARFAWTQEQSYPVRQWWQESTQEEKDRFFEALKTGRLEITGTPFNVTAFMSKEEWDVAMHWLPDELWEKCNIRTAMQIDVNGMHTYGMNVAYDRGVHDLWIGPNYYYGAPPMPAPTAFQWQIAEDKKMFVWLNASYNNGYYIFNENWRQGPVPNYSDLRYRPPEAGDILASDDESIMKAHQRCLENLARIEGDQDDGEEQGKEGATRTRISGGYRFETLPVSVTSQWRIDNDPPFYPIVDFVKRWNELGLEPRIVICTASQAMDMVKAEMGDDIPCFSGQWVDWWANGNASAPAEMSYNREAKRTLKAAESPLLGELDDAQKKTIHEIYEDICLYDEHCFSSWASVSTPYSFTNLSQAAEKNGYVYRALDGAQCLLAERAREITAGDRNRIVVMNPTRMDKTAWVELPVNCMRGEYASVRCEETGEVWPVEYVAGIINFARPESPDEFSRENVSRTFSDRSERQSIRFGPVNVPAMQMLHLIPETVPVEEKQISGCDCHIDVDEKGWPVKIHFAGQDVSVVDGAFGEFVAVRADGFAPRWTFRDIFEKGTPEERAAQRKESIHESYAEYEPAVCTRSAVEIRYEQALNHDAFLFGTRILKVDLINRRVELEFRMNRKYNFAPEVLFLRCDAPGGCAYPHVSNAGVPFRPELDQLPGSCMDFYAIDGWIRYPNGWMLNSTDAALVSFGDTSVVAKNTTKLGSPDRIYVRLFDNIWDTNFSANASGILRYRFVASADVALENAASVAENMEAEPVVVVKMGYREKV